jgi:glutaminyl-peptide cyclotransferase
MLSVDYLVLINHVLRYLQTVSVVYKKPLIIRSFPHLKDAYTQGLCFAEGRLYESTGTWNDSSIRQLDVNTGIVLEKISVGNDFAEDIVYQNSYLYQLTWQSGRILKYAIDPLRLVGEMSYEHEGWGIGKIGKKFVISDGSAKLRYYQPEMQLIETRQINCFGFPFRHLNAMEIVENYAFINVWYTSYIAQIDLNTARIVRMIDCSELVNIESPANPHNILNGIAFNQCSNTFFVTGKCWRYIFEISDIL